MYSLRQNSDVTLSERMYHCSVKRLKTFENTLMLEYNRVPLYVMNCSFCKIVTAGNTLTFDNS